MVAANGRLQSMRFEPRSSSCANQIDIQHLRDAVTTSVQEKPMAVTLAAFGIGMGLGIGLCSVLMESCVSNEASTTESISDRIKRMLPEALAHHFRNA